MNDSSREAFRQWAEPRREAVKNRSPQEQWIWSQAWEEAWFAREAEIAQLKERVREAKLEAECAAMREAILRLQTGVPGNEQDKIFAEHALSGTAGRSLLERLEKMEKALEHYADEQNWDSGTTDGFDEIYLLGDVQHGYEVARQALLSSSALAGDKNENGNL